MENVLAVLFAVLALLVGGLAGGIVGYNNAPVETVTDVVVVNQSVPVIVQEDGKVGAVYDKLYADEIEELEDDAIAAVLAELDNKYFEDRLEALGYEVEKIKSYEVDEDETEVTIVNLGLEDEDDKAANVTLEVLVKYKLKTGADQVYKAVVGVEGSYTLDDGDAEVELN